MEIHNSVSIRNTLLTVSSLIVSGGLLGTPWDSARVKIWVKNTHINFWFNNNNRVILQKVKNIHKSRAEMFDLRLTNRLLEKRLKFESFLIVHHKMRSEWIDMGFLYTSIG